MNENPAQVVIGREPNRMLGTVYTDDVFRIGGNNKITEDEGVAIARTARDAYLFVARVHGVAPTGRLANPIWITPDDPYRLASYAGPQALGVTISDDVHVLDQVATTPARGELLAHELTHVIEERNGTLLPTWLKEGEADVVGATYSSARHLPSPNTDAERGGLETLTRADAEAAIKGFADDSAELYADPALQEDGYLTGALFTEFLRTRFQGGKPDALARLASVGRKTFDSAFGASLKEATAAFLDWLGKTEGKPTERLLGTVFAR